MISHLNMATEIHARRHIARAACEWWSGGALYTSTRRPVMESTRNMPANQIWRYRAIKNESECQRDLYTAFRLFDEAAWYLFSLSWYANYQLVCRSNGRWSSISYSLSQTMSRHHVAASAAHFIGLFCEGWERSNHTTCFPIHLCLLGLLSTLTCCHRQISARDRARPVAYATPWPLKRFSQHRKCIEWFQLAERTCASGR